MVSTLKTSKNTDSGNEMEVTKQVASAFRQLGVVLYEDLSAESYFFFANNTFN